MRGVQATGRLIRHAIVQIDGFLPEAEVAALYDQVLAREREFVASFTQDANPAIRRSFVLNPPPALVEPVVSRVRDAMPRVLADIRLPPVTVGEIEAQVTASNDGSFFGIHTDADYAKLALRHLTYVYYFNGTPKGFTGGELLIYDDVLRENRLARSESCQTVEPRRNSIVFLWARAMHEVRPVRVPSRAFRDSRFTVNGWVNKARE